ncbi:MAG: hypothetical protein LBG64_04325 [Pseudomonadales bacterium]|jgi:hypothetical protein|nr:hypothetical protein [Pseudomonadales bacterium]
MNPQETQLSESEVAKTSSSQKQDSKFSQDEIKNILPKVESTLSAIQSRGLANLEYEGDPIIVVYQTHKTIDGKPLSQLWLMRQVGSKFEALAGERLEENKDLSGKKTLVIIPFTGQEIASLSNKEITNPQQWVLDVLLSAEKSTEENGSSVFASEWREILLDVTLSWAKKIKVEQIEFKSMVDEYEKKLSTILTGDKTDQVVNMKDVKWLRVIEGLGQVVIDSDRQEKSYNEFLETKEKIRVSELQSLIKKQWDLGQDKQISSTENTESKMIKRDKRFQKRW